MFKKNKILSWFLLFLAIFQASSQLLNYMTNNNFESNSPFLNIWISLGNSISSNWFSCTIVLISSVVGSILYNYLITDQTKLRDFSSLFFLLIVNLILSNQLYSNSCIIEKLVFIKQKAVMVTAFILIIFISIFIISIIKKSNKAKEDFDNSKSSHNATNSSNGTTTSNSIDNNFIWKHPFSYAWLTYKNYLNQKRQYKIDYKKKKIEIKLETKKLKAQHKKDKLEKEYSQSSDITTQEEQKGIRQNNKKMKRESIAATILTVITAAFIIFLISKNGGNKVYEACEKILKYFQTFDTILNKTENPIMNILICFGLLFLIVILISLLGYSCYFMYRIIIYFLFNNQEDNHSVKRFVRLIKVFFVGTIDGVMRPLLFIPDFLKHVEDILLDTDLDQKIQEVYNDSNNDSKKQ